MSGLAEVLRLAGRRHVETMTTARISDAEAEAAIDWFAARLADQAVVEAVAERVSWDGGDFTRWSADAVPDHNRWSWRGPPPRLLVVRLGVRRE